MTDLEILQQLIDDRGLTIAEIVERSGIPRNTLYCRLAGIGEFTASEIYGLTLALEMTREQRDRIFFAQEVECN